MVVVVCLGPEKRLLRMVLEVPVESLGERLPHPPGVQCRRLRKQRRRPLKEAEGGNEQILSMVR